MTIFICSHLHFIFKIFSSKYSTDLHLIFILFLLFILAINLLQFLHL
nr:MAG TPA: hypothetical protein [Caudoviricetes sp.]